MIITKSKDFSKIKEIPIVFCVSAESWVLWMFLVSSVTERSDFFFFLFFFHSSKGCLLKIWLLWGVLY